MDPFIGEIRIFAGNWAPPGWALCNGQLLSIQTNTALFAVIGTTYGGNGTTNFAVPNLQGRVPLHWGDGPGLTPYVIGEMAGFENVTLTVGQMPSHAHNAAVVSGPPANQARPSGNLPGFSQSANVYSSGSSDSTFNSGFVQPTGSSQPHTNIQPILALSFIIALQGIFPPHS